MCVTSGLDSFPHFSKSALRRARVRKVAARFAQIHAYALLKLFSKVEEEIVAEVFPFNVGALHFHPQEVSAIGIVADEGDLENQDYPVEVDWGQLTWNLTDSDLEEVVGDKDKDVLGERGTPLKDTIEHQESREAEWRLVCKDHARLTVVDQSSDLCPIPPQPHLVAHVTPPADDRPTPCMMAEEFQDSDSEPESDGWPPSRSSEAELSLMEEKLREEEDLPPPPPPPPCHHCCDACFRSRYDQLYTGAGLDSGPKPERLPTYSLFCREVRSTVPDADDVKRVGALWQGLSSEALQLLMVRARGSIRSDCPHCWGDFLYRFFPGPCRCSVLRASGLRLPQIPTEPPELFKEEWDRSEEGQKFSNWKIGIVTDDGDKYEQAVSKGIPCLGPEGWVLIRDLVKGRLDEASTEIVHSMIKGIAQCDRVLAAGIELKKEDDGVWSFLMNCCSGRLHFDIEEWYTEAGCDAEGFWTTGELAMNCETEDLTLRIKDHLAYVSGLAFSQAWKGLPQEQPGGTLQRLVMRWRESQSEHRKALWRQHELFLTRPCAHVSPAFTDDQGSEDKGREVQGPDLNPILHETSKAKQLHLRRKHEKESCTDPPWVQKGVKILQGQGEEGLKFNEFVTLIGKRFADGLRKEEVEARAEFSVGKHKGQRVRLAQHG